MKEAEEAEADPNDPLTAGLRKLAAVEITVLVSDAAQVTREETIRQLESKYRSSYAREEFAELETQMALGCGAVEAEDIDPDALAAIRRRAEWNAQAAERAGVVWRSGNRDQKQWNGHMDQLAALERRVADLEVDLETGALPAIDEINKQFDQEIDRRRELADRLDEIASQLGQHKASIARIAEGQTRIESERKIQWQKYSADVRRLSHVNGELVLRVVVLEAENKINKDSLRELRDLGQRLMDRLEKLEKAVAVLKAPIGALSPEPRTEPLPATCCGCICHVCAQGHDSGTHPHSPTCQDLVLGAGFWKAPPFKGEGGV